MDSLEWIKFWLSASSWCSIGGCFLVLLGVYGQYYFGSKYDSLVTWKLTEVSASVKGRTLTQEMRDRLKADLRPVSAVKIGFMGIQGDRESCKLADEIHDAFKEGGWTVANVYYGNLMTGSYGIQVRQKNTQLPGKEIADLLTSLGFEEVLLVTKDVWEDGFVEIVICSRP